MAGGLGYCGLDRRRTPLTGLELRGCWEAATPGEVGPAVDTDRRLIAVGPGRREGRAFVPLDLPVESELAVAAGPAGAPAGRDDTPALTLFGEPNR